MNALNNIDYYTVKWFLTIVISEVSYSAKLFNNTVLIIRPILLNDS